MKERGRLTSRSPQTEGQVIAALEQLEVGRAKEEVAREQGFSERTIYAWKAKQKANAFHSSGCPPRQDVRVRSECSREVVEIRLCGRPGG